MAATHVQDGGAQSSGTVTSAAGQAATFGSNVVVGNTIYVAVESNAGSLPAINSVTDNLGNVYSAISTSTDGTQHNRSSVYSAPVTTGGSCTVTVKPSITAFVTLSMMEFSSVTDIVDKTGVGGPTAGTTATTTSMTPTSGNDVFFAGMTTNGGGNETLVAGNSFIEGTKFTNTSNTPGIAIYKIASGAQTPSVTIGGSVTWVMAGAAFAESVGGSNTNNWSLAFGLGVA